MYYIDRRVWLKGVLVLGAICSAQMQEPPNPCVYENYQHDDLNACLEYIKEVATDTER